MIKPKQIKIGIKAKILLSLLPITIPIVVMVVLNFINSRNEIITSSNRLVETIIVNKANEINNYLENQKGIFQDWVAEDVYGLSIEFNILDELKLTLADRLENSPEFRFLGLLDKSGTIIVSTNPGLLGKNRSDWMNLYQDSGSGIVLEDSKLDLGDNGAPEDYLFLFPTHDSSGNMNGLFISILDGNYFQKSTSDMAAIMEEDGFTNSEISIVNLEKQIYLANSLGNTGATVQFTNETIVWMSDNPGTTHEYQYLDQSQFISNGLIRDFNDSSSTSSESIVRLIAAVPIKNTLSKVYQVMWMNLIIGIGSVIFVSLIVLFSTNRIVRPIFKMVNMLQDMARGEGDLTKRLEVLTKDELGELANWFNTFVAKLQELLRHVKNSTQQVGTAAKEISASSEDMATGAEEQQSQLSEIATSIEEMSAMILEASNNADDTKKNANEANKAADDGRVKVNDTVNGIEGIAGIVSSAADQISALQVRSSEIGEVIQVIDDIADQTNLLALNANIEAARAGDAGRGFAVVADEVRKLAERTVNATSEIGEKIKQIQLDINESVNAMSEITDKSSSGQKLAFQSGEALDQITTSIENVDRAISQIANAANEQSTGVEEISSNVESVSTVSKRTAESAQELACSADELNKEVQELTELLSQFQVKVYLNQ